MEGYAAPRRRNTLETVNVDLNFSVGFEPCRGQRPIVYGAVVLRSDPLGSTRKPCRPQWRILRVTPRYGGPALAPV